MVGQIFIKHIIIVKIQLQRSGNRLYELPGNQLCLHNIPVKIILLQIPES